MAEKQLYKKDEIFRIAGELHAADEDVTVRDVRDRLREPRGSFSDVCRTVKAWKKQANWRARPAPAGIPAGVRTALDAFVATLWAAALEEFAAERENVRAEVAAERRALAEVGAEMGAAADGLEFRVRRLEAELASARAAHAAEVSRLRSLLAGAGVDAETAGLEGGQAADGTALREDTPGLKAFKAIALGPWGGKAGGDAGVGARDAFDEIVRGLDEA